MRSRLNPSDSTPSSPPRLPHRDETLVAKNELIKRKARAHGAFSVSEDAKTLAVEYLHSVLDDALCAAVLSADASQSAVIREEDLAVAQKMNRVLWPEMKTKK